MAVGAMTIMLVGVHVDDEDSSGLGVLALLTLLAAFVLTALNFGQNTLDLRRRAGARRLFRFL